MTLTWFYRLWPHKHRFGKPFTGVEFPFNATRVKQCKLCARVRAVKTRKGKL